MSNTFVFAISSNRSRVLRDVLLREVRLPYTKNFEFSTRLSAYIIISDYHGIAIEQYALQPAIGAYHRADLFAEKSKNVIKDG